MLSKKQKLWKGQSFCCIKFSITFSFFKSHGYRKTEKRSNILTIQLCRNPFFLCNNCFNGSFHFCIETFIRTYYNYIFTFPSLSIIYDAVVLIVPLPSTLLLSKFWVKRFRKLSIPSGKEASLSTFA